MSKAHLRRSLARGSIWLYPPPWRERYGDEVRDLIETRGVTWGDLIGLTWRGCVERATGRALGLVDWSPTAVGWRVAEGLVGGGLAVGAVAAVMLLGVLTTMAVGAALGAWNWFPVFGLVDVLLVVPSLVFTLLPTALLLAWPGLVLGLLIACRWPGTARIVVVAGVCAFLFSQGLVLLLPGAVGGWVFAATLFPLPGTARASAIS